MTEVAALGLSVSGIDNIDRASASLDRLSRSGQQAGSSSDQMATASRNASGSIDRMSQASRRSDASFGNLARTITRTAAALGLVVSASTAIRSSLSTLSSFEESMSRVRAITRATADDMRQLSAVARELGATTEFTASQAADGLQFLGLAGFTAAQSIQAIPDVLNLATAASLDLGRAADIASNIMSAFGIAADNASRVTDVLAASSSRANTDVNQLGDAMSYVGPVAAAMGIDIGDAAAAVGVLSDAGIQGSSAGTGLRRVLSSLANPTRQAQSVLERLNVSLADVNPQTNDLADIIETLAGVSMEASDALTIFGDRGGPAVLALVENNDRLTEMVGVLRDVEGEADRMASTMRDNLAGDVRGMWSAIQELTLALSESGGLNDGLRTATQQATNFFRALSSGVSDGSLSAVIDDINETTRVVDFLEWRMGRFQNFVSGTGSVLSRAFQEGRAALGIYGQNLEMVERQIERLQNRLEGTSTGSLRNLDNRRQLAELEERREFILSTQGDMDATISLSRRLSSELEQISARMIELSEGRSFAARREASALADRQEEVLAMLSRVNSGFMTQEQIIESLGGSVEGWRTPIERVNDELTLMHERIENLRVVTVGSNEAVDSIRESLEAEHRQLTMTSRELLEYAINTALGEDANKAGAATIRDNALALHDQNEELRRGQEIRENVLNQLDRYFDAEERNSIRDARSHAQYMSRLEDEVAAASRAADIRVAGVGMGDRQRQIYEEQAAISQEFARRRTQLTENQLIEERRLEDHHYKAAMEALVNAEQARLNIVAETGERILAEQESWVNGARRGLENYVDSVRDVASSIEDAITNAFTGMEDALTNFVKTGKLSFRDLANSIIDDMIRIMIQQAITGPLASMFGGWAGMATSAVTAQAKGGAWDSGVQKFAQGGAFTNSVVSSPTMFPLGLMGEAGPEAIMPLSRGPDGKLGVRADSGRSGGGDVIITVNVNDMGSETNVNGRGESSAIGKNLAQAIQVTVRNELTRAQRQGGQLWRNGGTR